MKIRKAIKSDSAKDFSNLFFSHILQKFFGFIREPVTSFFFGVTSPFIAYQILRTAANLFSQFTVGNALKANLLPKFTKIYEEHTSVSLIKVFSFSKKSMKLLFFISQLIQSVIIIYIYMYTDINKMVDEVQLFFPGFSISVEHIIISLFIISIILSISICFNFFNMLYLIIIQAKGEFFKYSIATTLNSFIVVLFIIPLSYFFHIIGLVISRLLGIVSLTISYILPMNKKTDGYEVELTKKDINIPILVLGNFANIIIVSSQLVAGTGGSETITYFYYAVFILNAVLTSVIGNVSTILLRKISIGRNDKWIYLSLGVSVMIGLLMCICFYLFSYEIVYFIYMGANNLISLGLDFISWFLGFFNVSSDLDIKGKFGIEQVKHTSRYLYQLSYSFIFIFIATILFQPFFSLSNKKTKKARNDMSLIFLFVVFGGIFILSLLSIDVKIKSLVLIYVSSFVSVILSIYSYYYYLRNHVEKE